ncbi:hypothetical protein F4777DRAFT_544685 [Nemania sp. FL0916]|nr:hypothetical protein F4777DRAFT_544685 [Nemania sp. FL0916]
MTITISQQPDARAEAALDEAAMAIAAPEQVQNSLCRFWNSPTWYRRAPPPKSYPSISSIPTTSHERLAQAPVNDPAASAAAKTVLYLAYGSNLSAETFLGVRGIRPLSQINVSAPAFDLSFDLAGIPYNEPCFANTRPRQIPKPPVPIPGPGQPPTVPLPLPPGDDKPTWSKGLYGVVYEVTQEDYATIIKTEGGGSGYRDVLTACFALPPAMHVPEKPPIPELPKPFLAHTLYAPELPNLPGDDGDNPAPPNQGGDGDDDDGKDPRKTGWFRRLLLPVHRPDPDYAQASARYLKLIRDGAREHALPDDYQLYLAALGAYKMTQLRQRIGSIVFLLTALPILLLAIGLGRLLADDDTGRTPRWLGVVTTVGMNLLWALYDAVFKPLFGDGERTIPDDGDDDGNGTGSSGRGRSRSVNGKNMDVRKRKEIVVAADVSGNERNSLLSDW